MDFVKISREEVKEIISDPDKMNEDKIILFCSRGSEIFYEITSLAMYGLDCKEKGEIFLVEKFFKNLPASSIKVDANKFLEIFEYSMDYFEKKSFKQRFNAIYYK